MGKLIVIEGTDGSGKETQTNLLIPRIKEINHRLVVFSFPQYGESRPGTLAGKEIRKALRGEYGNFIELSPYIAAMPYAVDRACAKEKMFYALENGNVLCDRYVPSNLAHMAARFTDTEKQNEVVSFIENMEYGELGIPQPDMVICLHVSASIAGGKVAERAGGEGEKDAHEQDFSYQERVIGVFTRLANARENWHVVPCVQQGRYLSREEIHEQVWSVVEPRL